MHVVNLVTATGTAAVAVSDARDQASAGRLAMIHAQESGLRPVRVESVRRNATGFIILERD